MVEWIRRFPAKEETGGSSPPGGATSLGVIMKVTAFADAHGALPKIREECDLLLIGGDVCPVDQSHEPAHQRNWLRTVFSDWLHEQPAKNIVWIGGNHDFAC